MAIAYPLRPPSPPAKPASVAVTPPPPAVPEPVPLKRKLKTIFKKKEKKGKA